MANIEKSTESIAGKTINDYVVEFGHKLGMGLDAIKEAGKIYATALLKHPSTAAVRFAETYPTISAHTWDMLERIGNGDVHPGALLLSNNVAIKVSRLPVQKQNRIFEQASKGFKVVNPTTMRSRTIPLSSLSVSQASILIDEDEGKIRSEKEQREILKNRNIITRENPGRERLPKYRIVGNVCYIAGVEVGYATLKRIIAEMERHN